MAKALLVEKSFDETTESYEKFSHFFKECGESYCNIMTAAEKAQKFALFSPDETIPGFYGTLSVAVWQADFILTNIDEFFKGYGQKLKLSDIFDHLFEDRKNNKEQSGAIFLKYRSKKVDLINKSAHIFVSTCEQIKKLNEVYRDYASSNLPSAQASNTMLDTSTQNSHGSIFQSVNKMLISNKIGGLYSKFMHDVSDYIPYRESIKLCNRDITEYTHLHHVNLNKIDDTLFDNFLNIILPKVCQNISQLGQDIIEQANIFQSKIDQIDFETDFKEYVNNSQLSFKDIKAPKFEPYYFASPFASPKQIFIQKIGVNYFPVGVAIALSDFNPETSNEIQLKKGKYVYLMEKEPRNGWILVMTLPLAKIGFVPFSYLKVESDNIELDQNIFRKQKKINQI